MLLPPDYLKSLGDDRSKLHLWGRYTKLNGGRIRKILLDKEHPSCELLYHFLSLTRTLVQFMLSSSEYPLQEDPPNETTLPLGRLLRRFQDIGH